MKYFSIILIFFFDCSCGLNHNSVSESSTTDTDQQFKIDTLKQKQSSDSMINELLKKPLTPDEENELKRVEKIKADAAERNKLYGKNYTHDNEIEIIESKILYNSDFKPSFYIKVRNNLTVQIVAFEINVTMSNSNSKCDTLFKKKLTINPDGFTEVREKLVGDCNFDNASITLGDCVLANGKKIDRSDIFRNAKSLEEDY